MLLIPHLRFTEHGSREFGGMINYDLLNTTITLIGIVLLVLFERPSFRRILKEADAKTLLVLLSFVLACIGFLFSGIPTFALILKVVMTDANWDSPPYAPIIGGIDFPRTGSSLLFLGAFIGILPLFAVWRESREGRYLLLALFYAWIIIGRIYFWLWPLPI